MNLGENERQNREKAERIAGSTLTLLKGEKKASKKNFKCKGKR